MPRSRLTGALAIGLIVSLTTACRSPTPDAAEQPDAAGSSTAVGLAGTLTAGPHPVGYLTETLSIPDSRDHESMPTALKLHLWHPLAGRDVPAPPLRYADYYLAQESDPPDRSELRNWLLQDMTSPPGVTAEQLDAVLDATMWARGERSPAPGRHPLVLWSYRDSIPTMQAVLNEYLASHGYVVASIWPVDRVPPFAWSEGLSADDKRAALDTQVRLLEVALDELGDRPWVDDSSVALLSWSYGGESAAALERRRSEVDLVVGIDSTLASGWVYGDASDLAAHATSGIDTPYAILKHGRPRIGADETPAPALLAEIPAGAWLVRFPELSHGNFNVPGGMVPGVLELEEVSAWAVGGERARRGYEEICRTVLALLDHRVRSAPLRFPDGDGDDPFAELVVYRP